MLKFNNDNIFTGYLKQLLASFNLPSYRVYSRSNYRYKEKYGVESPEIIKSIIDVDKKDITWPRHLRHIPYIKDNEIQEYVYATKESGNSTVDASYWKTISTYYYNKKRLNYTKNLKIKNNIYDSYTHEYLGEYLRFLRDYEDIDLMPLYNCFTNNLCSNLYIEQTFGKNDENKIIFNSSDRKYKIFVLPVKLFKNYTIAIDCANNVEICCGIYGKYLNTENSDEFSSIIIDTYSKIGCTKFNQPFLYTKLNNLNEYLTTENLIELAANESSLKMFIKVPENTKSSIVVLEGNYIGWNDKLVKNTNKALEITKNRSVTNLEDFDEIFHRASGGIISNEKFIRTRTFTPITELQLLKANTGESYPFADRLIEYLSMNAITGIDDVSDNISRTQEVVAKNTNYLISDTLENGKQSGIWDERIRPVVYNKLQNLKSEEDAKQLIKNDRNILNANHDLLGYIDKDIEKIYSYTNGKDSVTISNIDIYPDIYKDQK